MLAALIGRAVNAFLIILGILAIAKFLNDASKKGTN